jgi:hypothetical protein
MKEGVTYDSLEYQGKTKHQVSSSFKIAVWSILIGVSLMLTGLVIKLFTMLTAVL